MSSDLTIGDGRAVDATIPGLHNFRPIGSGTDAAGELAAARLFRSDSPARLSAGGVAALTALGIDLIVDLRSDIEVEADRYEFVGLRRVGHPIAILEPRATIHSLGTLADLYDRLIDQHGTTIAAALRSIAHHRGNGVLVHCTAGKDRTGMVIALAEITVGVGREAVLNEYAATHANLKGRWTEDFLARAGFGVLPPHLLEMVNGSPAEVLARTLDRIDQVYGGVVPYLRDQGLTTADFDALHARLLHHNPAITPGAQ